MNHEEYIENSLRNCTIGDHQKSKEITDEVVKRMLSLYKDQAYTCLDALIKNSMNEIRLESGLIDSLKNGTTAKEYADKYGISVQTARKQLNGSIMAAVNREKRPYVYTLMEINHVTE